VVLHFRAPFGTMNGVVNYECVRQAVIFSEIDNTLYCSFSDRLDGHACSMFEQELLCHVAEFKNNHEGARIIFDLDGVIFVTSAFLRVCLVHLKTLGKNHFAITNVSEEIHEVFYISGFTEIMHVIQRDRYHTTSETMRKELTV
jgi:anti-anti-sigma factor